MQKFLSGVILSVTFASQATAADVFVGAYEHPTNSVSAASSLDGVLATHESGAVIKTGTGTWTVPIGAFNGLDAVSLTVANGTLALDYDDTTRRTVAAPTDVLANALFWYDASLAETKPELFVTRAEGDRAFLDTLYDVRETDTATPDYPKAVAEHVFRYKSADGTKNLTSNNAEIVKSPELTVRNGKRAFWFGGVASGRRMAIHRKGKTATVDTADVVHCFAVHEIDLCGGKTCFTGVFTGNNATDSFSTTAAWDPFNNATLLYIDGASGYFDTHMYIDGKRVDGLATAATKGFQIYEYTQASFPKVVNRLYYNPSAGGAVSVVDEATRATKGQLGGGDYAYELIAFTNRLTATERMRVYEYLRRKWFSGTASELCISAAEGAFVSAVSDGPATNSVARDAKLGLLVKSGAGDFYTGRDTNDVSVQLTPIRIDVGRLARERPFPVAVAPGDRITSSFAWDAEMTSAAADAGSGTIVKDGLGEALVRNVPEGTKKFDVREGRAVFAPVTTRTSDAALGEASDDVYVTIPNASFEARKPGDETKGVIYPSSWNSYQGWDGLCDQGKCWIYNVDQWGLDDAGVDGATRAAWGLTARPHHGSSALAMRFKGAVATTITVPKAGVYEFSYWSSGRHTAVGGLLDITFSNVVTQTAVARLRHVQPYCAAYGFGLMCGRVTIPAAGSYRLTLAHANGLDTDRINVVDDLAMRLCRASELPVDETEWPVPNGDFDLNAAWRNADGKVGGNAKNFSYLNNELEGWTFIQPEGFETSSLNLGVGLACAGMRGESTSSVYYNSTRAPYHSAHLTFTTNGAAVSATFTPPAGTWYVKCDAANNGQSFAPKLSCTVKIGEGDAASLGTIAPTRKFFDTYRYSSVFTADGETPVTLTFTMSATSGYNSGSKRGALYLDNVALSRRSTDVSEKYRRLGFWTSNWSNGGGPTSDDCGGFVSYKSYPSHGTDPLGGDTGTFIRYCGCVTNHYNFAAGCYRLSWYAHRVCANPNVNPFYVWLARGGVTNRIAYTYPGVHSNLVEYSAVFRITEPGVYTMGFQGTKEKKLSPGDAVVDNITLATADEDEFVRTDTFFPRDMELHVAADAHVHLGFEGTNQIERLRIGGRSVTGVVSASTHPDVFTGPGALLVEPHGMTILIR